MGMNNFSPTINQDDRRLYGQVERFEGPLYSGDAFDFEDSLCFFVRLKKGFPLMSVTLPPYLPSTKRGLRNIRSEAILTETL